MWQSCSAFWLFFFATTPVWQLWFQTHLQKLKENEQSSNSSSMLIRTLPYPPAGEEHLDVHRRNQLKFLLIIFSKIIKIITDYFKHCILRFTNFEKRWKIQNTNKNYLIATKVILESISDRNNISMIAPGEQCVEFLDLQLVMWLLSNQITGLNTILLI